MTGDKEEIIKKIVVERIKSMAPNVRIALGSKAGFLNQEQLLDEINKDTAVGKKIIEIQMRYLRALKEGVL